MLAASLLAAALALAAASLGEALVVRAGNLRIGVLAQILPYKLPRVGTAPIAVFVSGHVDSVDGSVPPQLQSMSVLVNRHGLLRSEGLPTCALREIDASSSDRALKRCGDALVGSGRFWATIVLPDQRPYPTRGRLLLFNGRIAGHPAIFAHIFTTKPFASAFAIPFAIERVARGPYATRLSASFPKALGEWGFVDRIKLTLRRKYTYRGQRRSYFNAGCPAPAGIDGAVYPLAYASFDFAGQKLGLSVPKSCGVKE
jgi:hypothetical protein